MANGLFLSSFPSFNHASPKPTENRYHSEHYKHGCRWLNETFRPASVALEVFHAINGHQAENRYERQKECHAVGFL